MKSLAIVLDGITVQHAGELLFDSSITSDQRTMCRETYIRCLEDFAFALVYASRFAVSGSLPRVGKEVPGLLVTTEYEHHVTTIEKDKGTGPEEILHMRDFRDRLASDLSVLGIALQRQRSFWRDFIIREAQSYLGTNETLYALRDPSEYVFGKTPAYLTDRELQSLIDRDFLDALADVIRVHLPVQQVSRTALQEFVSRTALTHFVIFWWYEVAAFDSLYRGGLRLPHVTRSLVRSVQKYNDQKKLLGDTTTMLGRHALFDAVSSAGHREEVIDRLHGLPTVEPYPALRHLVQSLVETVSNEQNEKKRERAVRSIREDIRRQALTRQGARDSVDLQLAIKFPGAEGGLTIKGLGTSRLRDIFSRPRRALRTLFRYTGFDAPQEYFQALDTVFPELKLREKLRGKGDS